MKLTDPVQYVKGVGPRTAEKFEKLGVQTVGDLLGLYPRRYIDYTQPYPVAQAPFDVDCAVLARIHSKAAPTRLSGGRTMIRVLAADDSAVLNLTWFNTPYAADKLQVGQSYYFEGRVNGNMTRREMTNPLVRTAQQVQEAPLVAVYPQTEGLGSGQIARTVAHVLDELEDAIPEPLPDALLRQYRLPGKAQAVQAIHRPHSAQEAAAARRRLIFEELLVLQLGITLMKRTGRRAAGAPMHPVQLEPFWASLPFQPTGAQRRSAQEIAQDLCGKEPMNRLLQGDVGSGKTLVAAAGVYIAARNGYQSALLAPTAILAAQHAEGLQNLLEPFGIRVALLTGGLRAKEKRATLEAISSGEADLVVGTHAVLTEGVEFARLGFAVVDEQHRFGVRQRGVLAGKASAPHLLVMSATPIPRTLGLLMYGDLDISVLDELPPGRKPIRTRVVPGERREGMYGFLRGQIEAGHQVYIVCPRVEGSEEDGPDAVKAVTTYFEEVAKPMLPGCRVGLMHGKLRPKEKDAVMEEFRTGQLDALVSTTVIEVGVDVPNATVMVIENAERYGLSALHQLRGRVGRGADESWCFLLSDHQGQNVQERLHFISSTQDGFAIARYDLDHRGPGDFFGDRQHGLPTLKIADLAKDTRILYAAQEIAGQLLKEDPDLIAPEHQVLAKQVEHLFERSGPMN